MKTASLVSSLPLDASGANGSARIAVQSLLIVSLMIAITFSNDSVAQTDQVRMVQADYPVTKVTERVYVIFGPNELPSKANQGFRSNPGFVLTSEGVVVIDPGISVYVGEMLLEKILTVTGESVTAIFNTHIHGDHWLANVAIKQAFPEAVIYAHPNMKAKADAGAGEMWIKMLDQMTEGAIEGTVPVGPDRSVENRDIVNFGDIHFRIHHFGPAHTNGDIMIEVVEEKVMFLGDIVRGAGIGRFTESFKGSISTIDLALLSKAETFVPGHGPGGGREVASTYRNFLQTLYDTVKKLDREGPSEADMKLEVAEALSAYKDWSGFDTELGRNISQVYGQIKAGSSK